jgi:hypothetical protein
VGGWALVVLVGGGWAGSIGLDGGAAVAAD